MTSKIIDAPETYSPTSALSRNDETDIRQLAQAFADCANRVDGEGFESLWTEDAVWTIDPPVSETYAGRKMIVEAFLSLLQNHWAFFIQMPTSNLIINSDKNWATLRCYVTELAQSHDGQSNTNYSVYEDRVVRTSEGWRFARRDYKTLYLDTSPLPGQIFERYKASEASL